MPGLRSLNQFHGHTPTPPNSPCRASSEFPHPFSNPYSSCPLRLCPKPCTFLRAKPGNVSFSKRDTLSNPALSLPYHPLPTAYALRVSLVVQKGQGEERRAVEQEGTRWSTIPSERKKSQRRPVEMFGLGQRVMSAQVYWVNR